MVTLRATERSRFCSWWLDWEKCKVLFPAEASEQIINEGWVML